MLIFCASPGISLLRGPWNRGLPVPTTANTGPAIPEPSFTASRSCCEQQQFKALQRALIKYPPWLGSDGFLHFVQNDSSIYSSLYGNISGRDPAPSARTKAAGTTSDAGSTGHPRAQPCAPAPQGPGKARSTHRPAADGTVPAPAAFQRPETHLTVTAALSSSAETTVIRFSCGTVTNKNRLFSFWPLRPTCIYTYTSVSLSLFAHSRPCPGAGVQRPEPVLRSPIACPVCSALPVPLAGNGGRGTPPRNADRGSAKPFTP